MDKILLELSNHAQEDLINDLINFIAWLNYKNLSQNTIKGYISDIKQSLVFFANSYGEKINHNKLISLPKSIYLSLIAEYAQTKSQKSQERLISTWKKWHEYKLQKNVQMHKSNE
jgi:site-specific recombinase XerD